MGRELNKKGLLFTTLFFCTLFISFNTQFITVEAQEHDLVLNLNNNFEFLQSSTMQGSNSSVNSINMDLPTNEWNMTKIELDFTNITFETETIVVEDTPTDYEQVYYDNSQHNRLGLATQIRLTHPTTIYGVYIYGNKSSGQDIQVQIQGYDEINNQPNYTIYLTQTLNISTTLGWHFQNFSSLDLPTGNYFLVLNGTGFSINGQYYHWYYNSDPSDPTLYSAMTEEDDMRTNWLIGENNKTFLYKLIRKSKAPLFPESINMSVNINNQNYLVLNNVSEGNGFLSQTIQNFRPESLSLSFPVNNNASKALTFNFSYYLYFEEILTILGTVDIQESQSNHWTLSSTFIRYTDNYTVKFNIPSNWENITILRDEEDMNLNVTITENYIIIPNIILIENADWEIQAESPNFTFGLNAPKMEYYLGQELGFSLVSPRPGYYTFILINANDIEEERITKTIPPETSDFTYELPSSSPDGTYIAYMFWNNGTDAAVQVLEFIIKPKIAPEFDPTSLIIVGVIISIVAVLSIISYIGIKKFLDNRNYKIERVLEKCIDILNLNYLIVTDSKSGIDIYSQSFGEQKLDPSLISGFLQAIREFGSEARVDKGSRTVNIDYKDTVILMTEFVNIRLILNMKERPSQNFHYDIESLAYDIYKNYGKNLEDFRGNVKQFGGIKELVEKNLNTSFIYPLEVLSNEQIKLSQSEREMVNKALNFMKEHNFNYIYSIYLLPENECSPKDAQAVLNLISKGVFKPRTIVDEKD